MLGWLRARVISLDARHAVLGDDEDFNPRRFRTSAIDYAVATLQPHEVQPDTIPLNVKLALLHAVLSLVRSSNPQDEMLVIHFSDQMVRPTSGPFTLNIAELKTALLRFKRRWNDALYRRSCVRDPSPGQSRARMEGSASHRRRRQQFKSTTSR